MKNPKNKKTKKKRIDDSETGLINESLRKVQHMSHTLSGGAMRNGKPIFGY